MRGKEFPQASYINATMSAARATEATTARAGASHVPESKNSPSVQAQASPHTTEKLLSLFFFEHVIVPPMFWYLVMHSVGGSPNVQYT